MSDRKKLFENIFDVFTGKKTWVGYSKNEMLKSLNLPKLKEGVLSPLNHPIIPEESVLQSNTLYARNYSFTFDLIILISSFRNLGD